MNARETVAFWQDRQATYPGELARGLRDFARERSSAGEEVLAGSLIAAAARLEVLELKAVELDALNFPENAGAIRKSAARTALQVAASADVELIRSNAAPALPDRAELERRGAGGMSTDEGRELETVSRTRVQRRELYPFFEAQR